MPYATLAMQHEDEALSGDLSARLLAARRELLARMSRQGCHPEDGWRIHEELASTPTGTAYILRAVHRIHVGSPELAVSVSIDS